MDWAKVTKIHTPQSTKPIPPLLTSMRCTKKISRSSRDRNALSPPLTALFGADQKERSVSGHRMAEEILRMLKVIADIAQRGGNVIIISVSWALNIKA